MQTSRIPENQKPHADRDLVQMYEDEQPQYDLDTNIFTNSGPMTEPFLSRAYRKATPARRFDCSTAFIGLRQLRTALACCVQEKAEYLAEGRTFNTRAAHWLFLRGIECSTVAHSRPRYL